LRGEKPAPPRQVVSPLSEPPVSQRAPEIELITTALTASGASKSEVEASVKLMEAIRSHAAGQPSKSDNRLDLGDLTMIAVSMGQGKMAASLGTSVTTAIQHSVQSVEGALGLAPPLRPEVPQDVNEILKKAGHLIKMVVKLVKGMGDKEGLRDSQGG
jgi:hypothetical protein